MAIEDEGLVGQARHFDFVAQIILEEVLNARVCRAHVLGQQAVLLAVRRHQPADQIGEFGIVRHGKSRATEIAQLEIDVKNTPPHGIRIFSAAGNSPQRADFSFEVFGHDKTL